MRRNIDALSQGTYDVVVIGGGIHGACAAWRCAQSGLKVALIEKGDFGSLTSANSLKIIHGGFRYLQHLNIKRMRESITSRRIMSMVSPENVQPLRCAIPSYGFGMQSKYLMRLALLLNDTIAFDRNNGIESEKSIPSGEILNLAKCRQEFPDINWSGKSGGAVWYDALAKNSERLTLSFIQEASELGATVANYVEFLEMTTDSRRVNGVVARDLVSGEKFSIDAESLLIASGPANDRVAGIHQPTTDRQKQWAKGVNVIVRKKIVGDTAIGLKGSSGYVDQDAIIKKKGRFFFFVPWRGYTMIGTTYAFQANRGDVQSSRSDVEDILEEVNSILPDANLTLGDVTKVHAGLVPSYEQSKAGGDVQLIKETTVTDLSKKTVNPISGVYTIKSVKYTTAPIVGAEAAEKICSYLGAGKCKNISINVSGLPAKSSGESVANSYLHQVDRYGRRFDRVLQYLSKDDSLICENPHFLGGEIDYLIEEEMAITLADVVLRRTELGTAECPPRNVLELVAGKLAAKYGWDEIRVEREIQEVEKSFCWSL